MAELVIANAPFKKYPGGVIVLRAKDWMGSARGTLSSEVDSRACSGFAVRDTQKVAPDIQIADSGSYTAAADTLTIDLSQLPIESMTYHFAFSTFLEGDWNPTDNLTTRTQDQYELWRSAHLAWTLDSGVYNSGHALGYYPRNMPHYCIASGFTSVALAGAGILHVKAYSFSGTSIAWLIDQIFLIPLGDSVSVDGNHPLFSTREANNLWIDGADNGDDLGKFTLHPSAFETNDQFPIVDGTSGDYQRKASAASAEYSMDVIGSEIILGSEESDFYYLVNSQTDQEAPAHCYGFHGPYLIPNQTWVDDNLNRTVGDGDFTGSNGHFVTDGGWGTTPQGFFWTPFNQFGPADSASGRYGKAIFADGSKGVMHVRRLASDFDLGELSSELVTPGVTSGAGIMADNLSFTGKFRVDFVGGELVSGTPSTGDDHQVALVWCRLRNGASGNQAALDPHYSLEFAYRTGEYKFEDHAHEEFGTGGTPLVDWTSLPWWSGTAEVAFRIEVYRYLVRFRVWQASGAEPSTWNYEEFRNLRISPGVNADYPYTGIGQGDIWAAELDTFRPECGMSTGVILGGGIEEMKVSWDDIKVEYNCDNRGSNTIHTDTHFAIERPKGTQVDSITVPAGAQYMVYWGKRDWTELFEGLPAYVDFALRAWNSTNAPMLQRAETLAFWFRSVHAADIASIFWHPYKKKVAERKFPV